MTAPQINYTDFEHGFNQVILEESVVLNVKTTMSFVDFDMLFAVNENYPLYTPPPEQDEEDEQEASRQAEYFDEEENDEEIHKKSDDHANENYVASSNSEILTEPDVQDELEDNNKAEEDTRRYSYRRGRLFFPNMEQVKWQSRIQPIIDPGTGSVDYGSIDYFYLYEGRYFLAGYWGELEILSGAPLLEIDELKAHHKKSNDPKKKM
ncbi:MAG: hypothetical protein AAGI66_05975 [Cyanobacteria bacterium P01_H01_bin.74]